MRLLFSIVIATLLFSGCSTDERGDFFLSGVEEPIISLDGIWKFSMKTADSFPEEDINIDLWSEIGVPGECTMQGYAIRDNRPFVYGKKVNIPKDYLGHRIMIKFSGVYSYSRVWVNGYYVRDHRGGFTAWECDITDYVTPGEEALMFVEVTDNSDDISYGSGYAKHQIGGILRSVELMAVPEEGLENIFIETDLDKSYTNAELIIYSFFNGESGSMIIELTGPDGKRVNIPDSRVDLNPGDNRSAFKIENPAKWDSEHPALYDLVITCKGSGDEVIFSKREKIGFREIVVLGNKLLINGDPVKLRGACRHDIHPTLGRTTTSEYDLKDVLLAKGANINFIRTSHYPPSETFLDYCDEYGIYVEDETAVCFVNSHRSAGFGQDEMSGTGPDNQYLSQVKEMVYYHRNHPSIIMWSIGNENQYNDNFKLSYDYIKESDPTRPVIYSYPGGVPDSVLCYDILSMHYPSYRGDVNNQWGISTEGFEFDRMPVLFDEWAHVACYNKPTLQSDPGVRNFWGESLDKMWSALYESEGGLGGAIWGYIDETFMLPDTLSGFNEWWGIMDEKILPSMYEGPCVGYGEWGIIDTWRRKKPEFWNTKKAYTPVKVMKRDLVLTNETSPPSITVHNRFNHTNLNELVMIWSLNGSSKEINCPDIEPGDKGAIPLPDLPYRSEDVLHLKFAKGENVFDEYNITFGKESVEPDENEEGIIDLINSESGIAISGSGFNLFINATTGRIENLVSGTDTLIKEGPFPRITVPGDYLFYSTIKMNELAQEWLLDDMDLTSDKGIVRVAVTGNYGTNPVKLFYLIRSNGVVEIDYTISGIKEGTRVQEAGLKFITGNTVSTMEWDRNGYWSYYPPQHVGSRKGKVNLHSEPSGEYRKKPAASWADDQVDFYYHGKDRRFNLSKRARAQRENFYTLTFGTDNGSNLIFFGDGRMAGRVGESKEGHEIFINSEWDYTSLLWGNFDRQCYLSFEISDQIIIQLNN